MQFFVKGGSLPSICNNKGGYKLNPKKVQGIMDIRRPTTAIEARAFIGLVQYYRDMWNGRSHLLDPLTEAARIPEGRKMLWNGALEIPFK